jgi:thymidylate kinase
MISVAIIGPDGAGKSTISQSLEREPMPAPVKRIYMGVNLESSGLMLPTTRLALAVKKARGRRSDMVAPTTQAPSTPRSPVERVVKAGARGVRLLLWLAEEWFRQAVASYHRSRGSIVVFDRHFYADYYHFDVAVDGRRSATSRIHGYLLKHVYPKPDLVICLDAPGQVLFDRKGEASAEWLEQRRTQYLSLRDVVPHFVVVDADRPLEAVTREVATVITEFVEKRRT